jgi:hypothetical protein
LDAIPNPPKLVRLDRDVIAVLVYQKLGYNDPEYRVSPDQDATVQFLIEYDPIKFAYHLRLASQIVALTRRHDEKR